MTWFVVQFDAEDSVEAVPDTWYVKNTSRCYWPPEGTVKTVIIDFIKEKHCPEETGCSIKLIFWALMVKYTFTYI